MTAEQFYSPEGAQLRQLESECKSMLNRQGYYSKGVARLGNRIAKLKEKIEKMYPDKTTSLTPNK